MTATLTDRGQLVTPDEAAEMVEVSRAVIDTWASRGVLPRALSRPTFFWSDDVYDAQRAVRRAVTTRDGRGRFAGRITPA